jgi:hypothetical protein
MKTKFHFIYFFFYFDIIFEVIIVFFRYDRLVLEQEAKQKEWDVKENEHLQRKEEIEKLFEQVSTISFILLKIKTIKKAYH